MSIPSREEAYSYRRNLLKHAAGSYQAGWRTAADLPPIRQFWRAA